MHNLDPRETTVRIPSPNPGLHLFLRHLPPVDTAGQRGIVLYVHGGTFPSALSVAHRLDGCSWRDELAKAGFHVWGLDFHGFGESTPYPNSDPTIPLGCTNDASRQLAHAVRFILAHHGEPRLSMIAHSWGTMVAGHFAGRYPDLVDRMVFFGPIAPRDSPADPPKLPAWRLITLKDQWDRFTADVPPGEPSILSRRHFADWGQAYLDSDPASRDREPPAVRIPGGAFQDIFDAWAGQFPYDPALIQAPTVIIRGEWDSLCTDQDAAWLCAAIPGAADIRIPRATHLMHLEENRYALYRETEAFLIAAKD